MKTIGLIDADLLGRQNQRFPNLALMKISGYHKTIGDKTELVTDYNHLSNENMLIPLKKYDKIYLSKVFTDTDVPEWILNLPNLEYGGTGFFFDKAPPLSDAIEHHKPDYHLYDRWVSSKIASGRERNGFAEYLDYSIGFTTRGCFRKCPFCVNKKYDSASVHSPISEFLDTSRPNICLLDDNVFACKDWAKVLNELNGTEKPFKFKQGLDIRLLSVEKAKILNKSKYDKRIYFAFDDYNDRDLITRKLKLWRKHSCKATKLYVLVGYDKQNRYDDDFFLDDIQSTFERIKLVLDYDCLPFVMRYERAYTSPYKTFYDAISNWSNNSGSVYKQSFREFVEYSGWYREFCDEFEKKYPKIAERYFDTKRISNEHKNRQRI